MLKTHCQNEKKNKACLHASYGQNVLINVVVVFGIKDTCLQLDELLNVAMDINDENGFDTDCWFVGN